MNFFQDKVAFLDAENIALLQTVFKPRSLTKGEFFIEAGERSTEIGLVIKGVFRSYYIDQEGNDITKYFHPEGSLLCSYVAYLTRKESLYSIEALENSEIMVAKLSDFERISDGNYQLLLLYKKMIDEILVIKEEHALSFKLLNSIERYQQFLRAYPGLEKRIKQCHLASYLGITPVSLSRIRSKLNLNK